MKTINRSDFEFALYEAELPGEIEDVIRADYSGRCMYGDTCIGLVLDSERDLATLFARLGERVYDNNADELDFSPAELALAMRSDSMGRSMIYYFPGWKFEEDLDAMECDALNASEGVPKRGENPQE